MTKTVSKRLEVIKFDSLFEMLQYCKEGIGKTVCGKLGSEYKGVRETQWSGSSSLSKAIEIGVNGWEEGANLIKHHLDKLSAVGTATTLIPQYEVSGDSVDVGRFLSGEPENMLNWLEAESEGHKIVDVYFNCSVGARTATESIIRYGSAALTAIDYLEQNGYRCNLYIYFGFHKGSLDRSVIVKIKDAHGSLNISTAAFCIAHPSYLRRLMLKIIELNRNWHQKGYGTPREATSEELEGNCVYFNMMRTTEFSFMDDAHIQQYLSGKLPSVLNELKN